MAKMKSVLVDNVNGVNFDTIKTEKVIIVGNSPSILTKELGSIIDSYDVVIRINRCITNGFEKHVGKKINVWATTKTRSKRMKELNIESFIPDGYENLDCIWLRTPYTKNDLKLPKKPKISKHIMYKTPKFKSKFTKLTAELKHEPCTGLLTILTSTLFYKDITLVGFTFYTEQKDEDVFAYYRSSEVNGDGVHVEDSWWKEAKKSGIATYSEGARRQGIVKKLVDDGIVKILNEEELGEMNL
jgi:hypothetical protein